MPKNYGTLEELQRDGLNHRIVPSCSEPDTGRNMGCELYLKCFEPERTVSGPFNAGLQIIKNNGGRMKVVHTMADCMWLAQFKPQIEANGGVVTRVAKEGEEIIVRGTVVRDEVIPGQGLTRFHDDTEHVIKIKPYPHTLDHPDFKDEAFGRKVLMEEQEKIQQKRLEEAKRTVMGNKK